MSVYHSILIFGYQRSYNKTTYCTQSLVSFPVSCEYKGDFPYSISNYVAETESIKKIKLIHKSKGTRNR